VPNSFENRSQEFRRNLRTRGFSSRLVAGRHARDILNSLRGFSDRVLMGLQPTKCYETRPEVLWGKVENQPK
jgi:hypothetical protein